MSENFEVPQSRNEALLQNILGAENELLPPESRNEAILTAILEGLDEIPAPYVAPPQSRIEKLLVELWESSGDSGSLFKSLVDRSITTVTADDLAEVTKIGAHAFYACPITSIEIPESVTMLDTGAFQSCNSLQSIVIPASVNQIQNYVFTGCTILESVTILRQTPPTLGGAEAFNNTNSCPIYVPAASVDAYKAATNWSALADRIFAIQE